MFAAPCFMSLSEFTSLKLCQEVPLAVPRLELLALILFDGKNRLLTSLWHLKPCTLVEWCTNDSTLRFIDV